MGYTKQWVPPAKNLTNNLATWKSLATDIDANLIAGGMIDPGDSGQLVISGVSAVPAVNTYAGYRIYQLNDGMALPIFVRLDFGNGQAAIHSSTYFNVTGVLGVRVTIGSDTDGAGTITGTTISFDCPLTNTGSGTGTLIVNTLGQSFLCSNFERGFFGCAYQIETNTFAKDNQGYNSMSPVDFGTLVFFIQRTYDENGIPTNDGYAVFCNHLTRFDTGSTAGSNAGSHMTPSYVYFYDNTSVSGYVSDPAVMYSRFHNVGSSAQFVVETVFASNNALTLFDMNCIAHTKVGSAATGAQVEIQIAPGLPQNMICLGSKTGLSIEPSRGQNNVYMLWE